MTSEFYPSNRESSGPFDWTTVLVLIVSGGILVCCLCGAISGVSIWALQAEGQSGVLDQGLATATARPRPSVSATATPRRSATTIATEAGILPSHREGMKGIAYSLDGKSVYSMGQYDTRLLTWDANTHEPIREFTIDVPLFNFDAMAFSADRTLLATADGHYVHVWDVATGESETSFQGHQADIAGIAFSPDGLRLVATSQDYRLAMWDFSSGDLLSISDRFGSLVETLLFSPAGRWLAIGQGDVVLLDGESLEPFTSLSMQGDAVKAAAFSPDSVRIVGVGRQGSVVIWDVETGGILASWQAHEQPIREIVWSPDGTRVASGSADNAVVIWDAGTGEEVQRFTNHREGVLALAWSPDGKQIVAGDAGGSLTWHLVAP